MLHYVTKIVNKPRNAIFLLYFDRSQSSLGTFKNLYTNLKLFRSFDKLGNMGNIDKNTQINVLVAVNQN